ncbi:hypothetical protein [Hyalangium gracile]|uniref:hypothetical protein n=1 Tax=Hyalangium gracile TaxID=394092 RepID=UPI001CCDC296|nr:hypothetical protein [Hyalangium gracile]
MSDDSFDVQAAAERFWSAFLALVAPLRPGFEESPRRLFEAVEQALQDAGFDLAFDVTADRDSTVLLILTPEGDAEVARVVDAIVACAPTLPGWRVFGRRQRVRSWRDALTLVGSIADVDLGDARFWMSPPSPGGIHISMVAAALGDFEPRSARTVAMLTLHHLLGEALVMRVVREVSASATDQQGREYMSPEKLVLTLLANNEE